MLWTFTLRSAIPWWNNDNAGRKQVFSVLKTPSWVTLYRQFLNHLILVNFSLGSKNKMMKIKKHLNKRQDFDNWKELILNL